MTDQQDDDDLTIAYMSGYKDGREQERKEFAAHAVDIARKAVESAKREWVGLTDEEREQATGWSVEHIEQVLKEKNT